jgi:hypothetical protein
MDAVLRVGQHILCRGRRNGCSVIVNAFFEIVDVSVLFHIEISFSRPDREGREFGEVKCEELVF